MVGLPFLYENEDVAHCSGVCRAIRYWLFVYLRVRVVFATAMIFQDSTYGTVEMHIASLTRSLLLGLLDPDVSDNPEKWCDVAQAGQLRVVGSRPEQLL